MVTSVLRDAIYTPVWPKRPMVLLQDIIKKVTRTKKFKWISNVLRDIKNDSESYFLILGQIKSV